MGLGKESRKKKFIVSIFSSESLFFLLFTGFQPLRSYRYQMSHAAVVSWVQMGVKPPGRGIMSVQLQMPTNKRSLMCVNESSEVVGDIKCH